MSYFGNPKDKYYDLWLKKLPSLEEKVVAITGTTSGTGYWAAVFAIRKNARALILLNRNSSRSEDSLGKLKAEKEKSGNGIEIHAVECDLMSFASVEKAAEEVKGLCEKLGGLSVLANNAGIMGFDDTRTEDGYEVQMQTNHLSHFLLTKLLMPSFQLALDQGREVRICQHSSAARDFGSLKSKYFEKSAAGTLGGNGINAKLGRYGQSKLCNTAFALMLHKKLAENGYNTEMFKSVVAEPGSSATALVNNQLDVGSTKAASTKCIMGIIRIVVKNYMGVQSAADGALPMIHACFGEDVDSGDFYYPEKKTIGKPYKAIAKGQLVKHSKTKEKTSLNVKNQKLMWDKSEEVCGSFFQV